MYAPKVTHNILKTYIDHQWRSMSISSVRVAYTHVFNKLTIF